MDMHLVHRYIASDNVAYFKSLPDKNAVLNMHHPRSKDSAMHIASRYGSIAVLEYFLNDLHAKMEVINCDMKRPLHEAAQYSQEASVRILLEHGAEIDSLKRGDWTPLMLACTKQSETIVKMLLAAGADPHLRNKDGWNSFHIAVREGHFSMILLLIDRFPDIWDTKSHNLRTPLHTAALHGHKDVVFWMLHVLPYMPDERDSCGTTPLMDAFRGGHIEIGKLLIEYHGAYVCSEDNIGRQAIHHAAEAGQVTSIEFLVEKCRVDVNVKSGVGRETALHLAAKEGHIEAVRFLLNLGCKADVDDDKRRTAVSMACQGHHTVIVELIVRRMGSRPDVLVSVRDMRTIQ